jgi:hypothetical protein
VKAEGPRVRDFRAEDLPSLYSLRRAAFAPVFRSFREILGEEVAAVALADAEA